MNDGPPALRSMISPQRNSFAKSNGRGQEAPEVWPRPLGLVGRGERSGGGSGAGASRRNKLQNLFSPKTLIIIQEAWKTTNNPENNPD